MEEEIVVGQKLQGRAALALQRDSHAIAKHKPATKVRIVHILAPEIIQTDAANFRDLVQRLTGRRATAGSSGTSDRATATTTHSLHEKNKNKNKKKKKEEKEPPVPAESDSCKLQEEPNPPATSEEEKAASCSTGGCRHGLSSSSSTSSGEWATTTSFGESTTTTEEEDWGFSGDYDAFVEGLLLQYPFGSSGTTAAYNHGDFFGETPVLV